ncbi:hypothetical protein ACA910_006268 [Epithemia clementina (nom. ined.)]
MKVSIISRYCLVWLFAFGTTVVQGEDKPVEYGVDVSFPMHHPTVSTNYDWLPHNQDPANHPVPPEYQGMPIQYLGDRQSFHDEYMRGCGEKFGVERCAANERERVDMSLRQPQSMYNYTEMGFTKIRAPDHVFSLIKEFWELNKDKGTPEPWARANIYTNHWASRSTMVSIENTQLEGAGYVLKQHIWNAARDTIQEWTGHKLVECSLYGIRIYHEGAVLATHVDRLPLVSSAIINVDQDVDEPWPLEVIGHDGKAHNVTMLPGDMVLYESHSILHGRPFPLKGRFMANVFIHFEPIGPVAGQIQYTGELPPYVIPGSPGERVWRKENPSGHKLQAGGQFETGSTDAHHFAGSGELERLAAILDKDSSLVNVRDRNGWTPLHEAVRLGDVQIVKLLLDRGADANARTGPKEEGGSPLYYVEEYHDKDESPEYEALVKLLQEYNAKLFEPSLPEL